MSPIPGEDRGGAGRLGGKMSVVPLEHPSDEMLEMYALNQIGLDDLDAIEEHLLLCPSCQDRYLSTEQYIEAMKEACRTAPSRERRSLFGWSLDWAPMPALGWVGGVVGSILAVVLLVPRTPTLSGHNEPVPETEIQLTSTRGAEHTESAGGRVRLLIDTAELPSLPQYQVAVVSATGQRVWDTEVAAAPRLIGPSGTRVRHLLGEGTAAGRHSSSRVSAATPVNGVGNRHFALRRAMPQ